MEEPIDEIPDVKSPGCLRNLDFRMVLPKPCPRRPVTGLVDSGQQTSEGHATHGVTDQPRWDCGPGPVQNDKNTTSLLNPGNINKRNRVVGDRKQNTIGGS